MIIKSLYRYQREDGGLTISLVKPNRIYTELVRIIADEGKLVTKDGINKYTVVDASDSNGWYEIENPNPLKNDDVIA